MDIQGKILEIFDTQNVTDTFRKREFIVEYAENPQYPEFLKFELIQDKCTQLDEFSVGEDVTISFNLKGRKWTDPKGEIKYFNSLQAWRIQSAGNNPGADNNPVPGELSEPEWLNDNEEEDNDRLPF